MSTGEGGVSPAVDPNTALGEYRRAYPAKEMLKKAENDDQLVLVPPEKGMYELPPPPIDPELFPRHTSMPLTAETAVEARHLWVIRPSDVPVALEFCFWAESLEDKKLKHSNLTGGAMAHSGGEIWFIDEDRIAINANSGRYGAANNSEFTNIVEALRRCGYYVASMGFDLDNLALANAVFVNSPKWEEPL
jgi:hypothetical protein